MKTISAQVKRPKIVLVDFDRTLIGVDSLAHILRQEAWFWQPKLAVLGLLMAILQVVPYPFQLKVRSLFKQRLLKQLRRLPKAQWLSYVAFFRSQLNIALISRLKRQGYQQIIVLSASDQALIKQTLRGFLQPDSILANRKENLKAFRTVWHAEKVRRLRRALGDLEQYTFELFTDSYADLPLMQLSRKTYLIKGGDIKSLPKRKTLVEQLKNIGQKFRLWLAIFRPNRWYQNGLMLIGALVAVRLLGVSLEDHLREIGVSLVSLCLLASGNYGINEVFDAGADRFHPLKKKRAVAAGKTNRTLVILLSLLLYTVGLGLIFPLNNSALSLSLGLLILSGYLYNVPPFRLKDVAYLDFIFEAINNPIRLLIGWYGVAKPNELVPSSFLVAFWCMGIFLMAAKRFGEIRFLKGKGNLALTLYRPSLRSYSEQQLLLVMIAAMGAFNYMFGALSMKYNIDLIIMLPLITIWVVWFLKLAYEENTVVKDPERIFEKRGYVVFSLAVLAVLAFLFFSNWNLLAVLSQRQ